MANDKAYWCRCGNCSERIISSSLAELIFIMHEHWINTHGNIHVPSAGTVIFDPE